jgi:DNA-binding MarR family transcriptional regulator
MRSDYPDGDSVCSNGAMRRATRRLGQLYDDAIAPSGLKATQLALLNQIKRLDEPTLRVLADDLVMDLSALGHTLKPLVRDGLVELVADVTDRRAKRVTLTAAGVAKLRMGLRLWRTANGRFERVFGAENAAQLRNALDWIASPEFADTFAAGVRGTP